MPPSSIDVLAGRRSGIGRCAQLDAKIEACGLACGQAEDALTAELDEPLAVGGAGDDPVVDHLEPNQVIGHQFRSGFDQPDGQIALADAGRSLEQEPATEPCHDSAMLQPGSGRVSGQPSAPTGNGCGREGAGGHSATLAFRRRAARAGR